jgi:hypothetical protein
MIGLHPNQNKQKAGEKSSASFIIYIQLLWAIKISI